MQRRIFLLMHVVCTLFLGFQSFAQQSGPVARWSFDDVQQDKTKELVSGTEDAVGGYSSLAAGVNGKALRFDGYTTSVTRAYKAAPKMGETVSVAAWIAPSTYPWNWVPVVDFEDEQQGGYFFGVDAEGHVGMSVDAGDRWQTVVSQTSIPLRKWSHIAGSYDPENGLNLYIDGKPAGHLAASGALKAPTHPVDLLIGRIRDAVFPFCYIHPKITTWYSFDGLLDDVSIYDRAVPAEEFGSEIAKANVPKGEVLQWPVLPAGPAGKGTFGAYYATLKYEDTWDRLSRIGPLSDVVVRFESAPIRLVFWHGLSNIPAWVTENGKWYTDEFLESGYGGSTVYDAEPMSDKQTRYSRVNIVESTPARAVVHWRYALADVLHRGAHEDPLTHWFDWADEYYTVYPDGVAVRKQVLHHSDRVQPKDMWHEWQETIIVHGPGFRPEDSIQNEALTLANMDGQTATYSWVPKAPESLPNPPNANIQMVNLKSSWKPFQVAPMPASFSTYTGEDTRSTFEWWNHWPVGLIDSSGRCAVAPDRASHSSLSHIKWPEYARGEDSTTKLLMDGLTDQPAAQLGALAKSWLHPANATVAGKGYENKGYDPAERAYVVEKAIGADTQLTVRISGSASSPVWNPAILVRNWGAEAARVSVNGKQLPADQVRVGTVRNLDSIDLVVFLRMQNTEAAAITIRPPAASRE